MEVCEYGSTRPRHRGLVHVGFVPSTNPEPLDGEMPRAAAGATSLSRSPEGQSKRHDIHCWHDPCVQCLQLGLVPNRMSSCRCLCVGSTALYHRRDLCIVRAHVRGRYLQVHFNGTPPLMMRSVDAIHLTQYVLMWVLSAQGMHPPTHQSITTPHVCACSEHSTTHDHWRKSEHSTGNMTPYGLGRPERVPLAEHVNEMLDPHVQDYQD